MRQTLHFSQPSVVDRLNDWHIKLFSQGFLLLTKMTGIFDVANTNRKLQAEIGIYY